MQTVTMEGRTVVPMLPTILQRFAKAAKRRQLQTPHDLDVFAARYFARLSGWHVVGHDDLSDDEQTKTIHVYRMYEEEPEEVEAAAPSAGAAADGEEDVMEDAADGRRVYKRRAIPQEWEAIQHDVFAEIQTLRADPKAYAAKLEALRAYYTEELTTFAIPGGVVLSTLEGWTAYEECINELQSLGPLPALRYSPAITMAAMDGIEGDRQHVAPRDLCQQYGTFSQELGSSVAQSLCFNQLFPQSIVLHLLVDDNYKSRGNRQNLLSDEYQEVGIGFNATTCNLIFATNYFPNPGTENAVGVPVVPEEYEYHLQLNHVHFNLLTDIEVQRILETDPMAVASEPAVENEVIATEVDDQDMEIVLLDPPKTNISVQANEVTLLLTFTRGHLTATLTAVDPSVQQSIVDRGCLLQSRDHVAAIHTYFAESGDYQLAVSADLVGEGVYTQVFEYTITAHVPPTSPVPFPNTFLQSHNCYVHTPTAGLLQYTDDLTLFVVEAVQPTCGIAVLTGEQLMYLERRTEGERELWCGKVHLKVGKCKISTNLDGTHFEIFGLTVE